jgi:hypothetical protein
MLYTSARGTHPTKSKKCVTKCKSTPYVSLPNEFRN